MLDIIFVILPIFALMGLGYLAVLKRLYPAEGVKSLIAFVNNFATPCLLFYSISTSDFRSAFNLSIIGPFYFGDYWVLDHAEDYSWSIVGEPSGRFLWLLSRTPDPAPAVRQRILNRTAELGYDTSRLRMTRH